MVGGTQEGVQGGTLDQGNMALDQGYMALNQVNMALTRLIGPNQVNRAKPG